MLSFHSSSLSLQDKGFPWFLPFFLGVIAGQQKRQDKDFCFRPWVIHHLVFPFPDLHLRRLLRPELEGQQTEAAGQHDLGVQVSQVITDDN